MAVDVQSLEKRTYNSGAQVLGFGVKIVGVTSHAMAMGASRKALTLESIPGFIMPVCLTPSLNRSLCGRASWHGLPG